MAYVPTVVVDFDGTICKGNTWPLIGEPEDHVKESLELLRYLGYYIIISSCRTCHWHYDTFGGDPKQPTMERPYVIAMVDYLKEHEIPYDEIDDGSRGKPTGDFYIDDKGVRFEPGQWRKVVAFIAARTKLPNVVPNTAKE